jgi:hypothetical protein
VTNTVRESINQLVDTKPQRKPLPPAKPLPAIPASVGFSSPLQPEQTNATGIASPLTEVAYEKREFFEEVGVPSSDGLFVIYIRRIKKVVMKDAKRKSVELIFKEPTEEA